MLLRLIIIKKLLVAVLLLTVAVLALVGSYRYDQLPQLLQECTDNDHALLAAVVGRGLQDGQTRLLLTALVTGVYGVLIAVAARMNIKGTNVSFGANPHSIGRMNDEAE